MKVLSRSRANRETARSIEQYLALLDAGVSEEKVRRFLETHVWFWNGLLRMHNTLYTKIKLGADFEVDFVWCDPSSAGAEWHLVEIERPTAPLFTKAGEPSRQLNHAMLQVRDWQNWIAQHHEYADDLMPGIYEPMGHIFMGRRRELVNSRAKERLREINRQQRAHLRVKTLDSLADVAMSVVTWSPKALAEVFAPRASTDRELRRGLPADDVAWIRSDFGRQREFYRNRRLRDYPGDQEDERPVSIPKSVPRTAIVVAHPVKPRSEIPPRRGRSAGKA